MYTRYAVARARELLTDSRMPAAITLVCETCGNDKTFTDRVPEHLVCERCGGTVWREFDTPRAKDSVERDFYESTDPEILGDR
jgi:hypothetical protein